MTITQRGADMPELPSDDTGAWQLPEELCCCATPCVASWMRTCIPSRRSWTTTPSDSPRPARRIAGQGARARPVALQTPAEYGGAGLSVLGQVVVAEEAAKCRMGAFFRLLGRSVATHPTSCSRPRPTSSRSTHSRSSTAP